MKILEARIFYSKDQISKIVVLADFTAVGVGKPLSDVRAIMATDKLSYGYETIKPHEKLSDELIKRVADYGRQINTDEVFPDWKKTYS